MVIFKLEVALVHNDWLKKNSKFYVECTCVQSTEGSRMPRAESGRPHTRVQSTTK